MQGFGPVGFGRVGPTVWDRNEEICESWTYPLCDSVLQQPIVLAFDFEKMRSSMNFWRCWFQVIVRPWLGSRLTRSYSLVGIAPPVSCLIAPATSYAWPVPDPGIGCYANDRPSGGEGCLSCCHLRGRSWQESTNRKYQQIFVLRHLGRIH